MLALKLSYFTILLCANLFRYNKPFCKIVIARVGVLTKLQILRSVVMSISWKCCESLQNMKIFWSSKILKFEFLELRIMSITFFCRLLHFLQSIRFFYVFFIFLLHSLPLYVRAQFLVYYMCLNWIRAL